MPRGIVWFGGWREEVEVYPSGEERTHYLDMQNQGKEPSLPLLVKNSDMGRVETIDSEAIQGII